MKIFFVMTPAYNPIKGGVQRATSKTGKYLFENGYQVWYYSLSNEGNVTSEHGTVLNAPNIDGVQNIEDIKPEMVINQMSSVKLLRNFLAKQRDILGYKLIGCLHNSLFKVKNNINQVAKEALPSFLFNVLNNKLGMKIAFQYFKFNFSVRLKDIINKHDYYVLLAPPNKNELEYYIGKYKPEKIHWIPNSIEPSNNADLVKEKVIVHVGRIETSQKKSDLLLPIWKLVQQKLPDWKFVVVGDGPYKKTMEEQIEKENIKNVTLTGFQNPEPYFQKGAIFLMTSSFEGFPNVILEAQSFGAVTVAFNTYEVLPWLVNKEDSIIVAPYDLEAIASEIVSLANDQIRLSKMAEASVKNIERFTLENVGKQWVDFVNSIKNKNE